MQVTKNFEWRQTGVSLNINSDNPDFSFCSVGFGLFEEGDYAQYSCDECIEKPPIKSFVLTLTGSALDTLPDLNGEPVICHSVLGGLLRQALTGELTDNVHGLYRAKMYLKDILFDPGDGGEPFKVAGNIQAKDE